MIFMAVVIWDVLAKATVSKPIPARQAPGARSAPVPGRSHVGCHLGWDLPRVSAGRVPLSAKNISRRQWGEIPPLREAERSLSNPVEQTFHTVGDERGEAAD